MARKSNFVYQNKRGFWWYVRRVPIDAASKLKLAWWRVYIGDVGEAAAIIKGRELAVEHDKLIAASRLPTMPRKGLMKSSNEDFTLEGIIANAEKSLATLRSLNSGTIPRQTVSDLVPIWFKRGRARSDATMRQHVALFESVVGKLEPGAVTRKDVGKFRDYLESRADLKRDSAKQYLSSLHALFAAGVSALVLDANPCAGITVAPPKVVEPGKRGFTDAEVATILGALPAMPYAFQLATRILAAHGMRSGELAGLRVDDLADVDGVRCLRLHEQHRRLKNQYSIRDVPVHPSLLAELEGYARRRNSPWLFDWDGSQGRGPAFQRVSNAWLRQIGITDKNVSTHGWRHRWRTLARNAGMPIDVVEAIQGWAAKGMSGAYGERVSLALRLEWLSRIKPLA
jgi:integrase